MKDDYANMGICELLAIKNKSLRVATILANKLTKFHKQYWTTHKNSNGNWYAHNRFNPVSWK